MEWYYKFSVTVERAKIRRLWKLFIFAENRFRFLLKSYMYSFKSIMMRIRNRMKNFHYSKHSW
jgi:hypothetical protein